MPISRLTFSPVAHRAFEVTGEEILEAVGFIVALASDLANAQVGCVKQLLDLLEADIRDVGQDRRSGNLTEPEVRKSSRNMKMLNDVGGRNAVESVLLDERDGLLDKQCGRHLAQCAAAGGNAVAATAKFPPRRSALVQQKRLELSRGPVSFFFVTQRGQSLF